MGSVRSGVIKERREGLVEVSRSCPEKVYVELHLPDEFCAVNQVIFRTMSHDQGFSNDEKLYGGTYQNSCTWFMVAVVSPGGHDRVPKRILHYNVHASSQFRRHNICWEAESEDASIREWVNGIRRGDTIQIIPKAQYPAWINFVQEAEIEVHYYENPPKALESQVPRQVVQQHDTMFQDRAFYRHLDEGAREIRLVLLNPGTFDQPISCSLAYTSLSEPSKTAYEALSYCWGDARHRLEISISVPGPEGLSVYLLSVTAALHSAMKRLRPQIGPTKILWIDAICINQADLDERSSQVALMTDVYRQANRVIVWLGEGNDLTKNSIRTIQNISDRCKGSSWSDVSGSDLARLHDPLMNDLGVSTFVDDWLLFESPWFRRTWVVQEIFNARKAVVCCGEDTLSWPMLLRVNKCIGLSGLKANSAHKALMPPIYEYLFTSIDATANKEPGILEVLVKGLDLDATDPRDKIFAMLQFGTETQYQNSLARDLVPDYRKSTSEVFSSFTKWWIVEHQSLRILSAIQALEGRTWHENFWGKMWKLEAQQPTWSWWYRGRSNWAIGILGLSVECPYRAAADTKPDIEIIMKSPVSILPLTGIRVGIIEKVMPYPYYRPPPNHENLHRAYIGIYDPLMLTGKCGSQLGSKNNNNYMNIDDPSLKQGHFNSHLKFSKETGAVECHGNCFFNTVEGLEGLCPFSAKPGDSVVILHGGPVPYVLRAHISTADDEPRWSSKYEFVGECYLQGYMGGQGIEEKEERGLPVEVFVMV